MKFNHLLHFTDSGVESSTTYAGHDGGAISDCELTQSQSIDEVVASPAPTLEDAMQRLAETIKGLYNGLPLFIHPKRFAS